MIESESSSDVGIDAPTRRRFLGVLVGAPAAALLASAWVGRDGANAVSRPPIQPAARPLVPAALPATSVNLLANPSFELDGFGTTITSWVANPTVGNCALGAEGIPASR